ncbi:MAG: DUF4198 domain-containing protein [Pseudomonadota bacterium]|nr:DUF4198 domain-containing protein [Pseudomonadota bacterium]
MTIARSLTFSFGLLIWSTQIQGHEFWIEPSKHYTTANSIVDLTLKVGETFRGSAQPYLPVDTATFIVIGQTKREIQGLLGDSRPAATVVVEDGLNRVIHQTTPFSIRFGDEDERWANYITLDGLQPQLDQHPGISQIVPVKERYVRVAKSFIKSGQAKVNDSLSGEMPFELVLEGQWAQIPPGNYAFTLYDGQTPIESVLVKAFRHSDRAVVSEAYTDANGRVELELPSADRYLISGVVIRPDDDSNYDWISHWPTITLEVVN